MNQILSTSQPTNKNGKKGPADIETILKFFAIALIVYGIFMIGSSSYSMYRASVQQVESPTKPTIEEEFKSDNKLLLKVMHDKAIETVEYYWNDEEPNIIKGNGRKYIEQEITIPGGTNTLTVKAIDINGQEIVYPKEFETPDIIQLNLTGNKLKVTAESETVISYMTYRWNEDNETRIDINSNTVDQEIDIPMGENTITIVLVDENNESIMKEQKIKGVLKPTITVAKDNATGEFIITGTDEIALDRIEFTITNSSVQNKRYRLRAQNGEKELTYRFKLEPGENYIEATAYNADGIESDVKKAKATW